MKGVAIIPARGGSKGVERKNMQVVGGETLIARCVKTAMRANSIATVICTTDDPEIAVEASLHGAKTLMRPRQLATDTASSEAVITHALCELVRTYDMFSVVAFLQCTSPLLCPSDIDACCDAVLHCEYDSAFCYVPFHGYVWDVADRLGYPPRSRRQAEPHRGLETGSCYAFRPDNFLEEGTRFCGRVKMVKQRWPIHIEIDTPEDLEYARAIIEGKRYAPL